MTNETTPDAVELLDEWYRFAVSLGLTAEACKVGRIRAALRAERARHAEEVARFEEEAIKQNWRAVAAEKDRDSLRSLLPDVRALAQWAILTELLSDHVNTDRLGDIARNILAALDSHECPECHRSSDHKMSCGRGGSKGGRFGVSLDSQGGEGE